MGRSAIFGERRVAGIKPAANLLTDKQGDILLYCWNFYEKNDQLPPMHAIAQNFKFSSVNAAHEHLQVLARKGWIERNACGKWKFTWLTRTAMEIALQSTNMSIVA